MIIPSSLGNIKTIDIIVQVDFYEKLPSVVVGVRVADIIRY